MYTQVFIMLFCIFSEGLKYFTIKSMRLKKKKKQKRRQPWLCSSETPRQKGAEGVWDLTHWEACSSALARWCPHTTHTCVLSVGGSWLSEDAPHPGKTSSQDGPQGRQRAATACMSAHCSLSLPWKKHFIWFSLQEREGRPWATPLFISALPSSGRVLSSSPMTSKGSETWTLLGKKETRILMCSHFPDMP